MIKFGVALGVGLVVFGLLGSPARADENEGTVTAPTLLVRKRLKKGDKVRVLRKNGKWLGVQIGTAKGWVKASDISLGEAKAVAKTTDEDPFAEVPADGEPAKETTKDPGETMDDAGSDANPDEAPAKSAKARGANKLEEPWAFDAMAAWSQYVGLGVGAGLNYRLGVARIMHVEFGVDSQIFPINKALPFTVSLGARFVLRTDLAALGVGPWFGETKFLKQGLGHGHNYGFDVRADFPPLDNFFVDARSALRGGMSWIFLGGLRFMF